MKFRILFAVMALTMSLFSSNLRGDIFATGFFSGNIQRFDSSNSQSTFATIAGNPGLSGIAYSAANNRLYVSALNHGGVYTLDATTGGLLGFSFLGIGPGGLAVADNGNVYVSDFTSNIVRIYDATLTNNINSINVPVAGVTSGVGFGPGGDVYIATPGTGVFRYDGNSVTSFSNNPAASAQIAADASSIYVGHGLGQSDSAFRFDLSGNLLNTFDITAAMMPGAPAGSSAGFSPSGIAIDANGNIIVGVLGRSNPGDAGGEFGGLFRFDVNGNLLETIAIGTNAFSGIVFVNSIPEPGLMVVIPAIALGVFARRRRR